MAGREGQIVLAVFVEHVAGVAGELLAFGDAVLKVELATEIDLRDGKADGKITAHPLRCPSCDRVSSSRHAKCLYCGQEFEGSLFGGLGS